MKKIFAILLAMAMVLSLGTALAVTWGNPNANTTAAAAVTISVTKYVALKDAANQPYYSKLDDAAIVKAGDAVAFQVKIVVPSANALNTQFGTTLFSTSDAVSVKIDGTNLAAGSDVPFDNIYLPIGSSAETFYLAKDAGDATPSVATGSNMYLDTAFEYGAVDLKINVRFLSEISEINILSGGDEFFVDGIPGSYRVYSDDYRANAYVYFWLNGDKVTDITVSIDGASMAVAKSDGQYQCVQGLASAAQKFAGDDFLNKVLNILGFSAADAMSSGIVYMDDINWAQNFGVYFNNSNNATYAAFTPVPVTVTPTTTIPKTGSNASVIGFAMVALAVVAAAVVAVKKVRA